MCGLPSDGAFRSNLEDGLRVGPVAFVVENAQAAAQLDVRICPRLREAVLVLDLNETTPGPLMRSALGDVIDTIRGLIRGYHLLNRLSQTTGHPEKAN